MSHREDEIVASIRARFPSRLARVGIGDDAAVVPFEGDLVLTSDMLVEEVDFFPWMPIGLVAAKSLTANLSDLAAMGATPFGYLLALAVPKERLDEIPRFLDVLEERSRRHALELLGGDLSSAPALTVSIAMFGRGGARTLLRSGARPGDGVYVSRPLGASAAGLILLRKGWRVGADGSVSSPDASRAVGYAHRELAESLIRRHADPQPEVALGIKLAEIAEVSSCIDLSDGLSTDLRRLCEASSVGAVLDAERLPIFPDLARSGLALGVDAEAAALHGGEDYALLFTSRLRESQLSEQLGRPVYRIGSIVEETGVILEKGAVREPLEDRGYDHFR